MNYSMNLYRERTRTFVIQLHARPNMATARTLDVEDERA